MANKKKGTTFTPAPPKKEKPMIIPGNMPVALGHSTPQFSTGVLQPKNTRRARTRSAKEQQAIKDSSE